LGFSRAAADFVAAERRDRWLFDAARSLSLDARVVATGGARHVVVAFPGPRPARSRPLVLAAHHDRVEGTPGALDNSAACLQLLDLASRLRDRPPPRALALAFTDAEELGSERGPAEQGSLALAGALRSLGWDDAAAICLDVTGRGDAPFVASPGPAFSRGGPLANWAALSVGELSLALRRVVGDAVRAASPGRGGREEDDECPELPAPYSDDLGFVLGGLPAVTLSLLPRAERDWWTAWSARSAEGEEARGGDPRSGGWGGASRPGTWRMLHGPGDTVSLLERRAFELMAVVLDRVARAEFPPPRSGPLRGSTA
jgi:hypothetical protein